MPDVLTVREAVQRAKGDGLPISEYSLRQWVRTGAIPVRQIGRKTLIFYPNLVRFLQCSGESSNFPATVIPVPGIRQLEAR